MPVWVQIVIGLAALVGALGVLWAKVIKPGARAITTADEVLPLLRELAESFRGTPKAFAVLSEIAAQFRTDSGSSLRDVVNRLEDGANQLRISAESARTLAEDDRHQLQRLVRILDRLTIKAEEGAASNERIEEAAKVVASDLEEAHNRADAASEDHGAAADAASKPPSASRP